MHIVVSKIKGYPYTPVAIFEHEYDAAMYATKHIKDHKIENGHCYIKTMQEMPTSEAAKEFDKSFDILSLAQALPVHETHAG